MIPPDAERLGPPSFYRPIPQDQLPPINRMSTCQGIVISFQVLAWLAVAFRVYCRTRLVRSFGLDDGVVILALLATTASAVILVSRMALSRIWFANEPPLTVDKEPVELFGQHFGVAWRIDMSLTTGFLKVHISTIELECSD
jgi:hypothetical protein